MADIRNAKYYHLANRPYTKLSGGERQQCIIAHVLVQEPQAILFDEPTAFWITGIKSVSCV